MTGKNNSSDELVKNLKAMFGGGDKASDAESAKKPEPVYDDDLKTQLNDTLSRASNGNIGKSKQEAPSEGKRGESDKTNTAGAVGAQKKEDVRSDVKARRPRLGHKTAETVTEQTKVPTVSDEKFGKSVEETSAESSVSANTSELSEEMSDFDLGMDMIPYDTPKEESVENKKDKGSSDKKSDGFMADLIKNLSRDTASKKRSGEADYISLDENEDDEFVASLNLVDGKHSSAVQVMPTEEDIIRTNGFVSNDSEISNSLQIPGIDEQKRSKKGTKLVLPKVKTVKHKKKVAEASEALDENDVALAIEFGYEYELAENIGYDNVKRHRNIINQRVDTSKSGMAFGYSGKEYTDTAESEEIRRNMQKAGTALKIRTIFTAVLLLILFALENIGLFSGKSQVINGISLDPVLLNCISLVIMLVISGMSARLLIKGFVDAMKFDASSYSAAGFSVLFALIYDVISIAVLLSGGTQYTMLNTAAGLTVLITLISRSLDYKRECNAFLIVSLPGKKYTVEEYDPIVKNCSSPKASNAPKAESSFRSAEVDMTGDYFERTAAASEWYKKFNFIIAPIFGVAVLVLLTAYIKSRDLMLSYTYLAATVIACMPVSMVLYNSVTFFTASRSMKKRRSAIIGESSVDEYKGALGIVFGERFMVSAKFVSLSQERSCDDANTTELMGYISKLVNELDSSVSDALKETFGTYNGKSFEFRIENLEPDGVEASVNSSHHIYIGERDYMTRHKLPIKPASVMVNNEEVIKKSTGFLYISVDEIMCWKISIDYKLKNNFASLAKLMSREGMSIGIETVNPNINDSFLLKRHLPPNVKLLHPDRFGINERSVKVKENPNGENTAVKLDSGIVAAEETDLVYPMIWCKRINSNLMLGRKISIIMISAVAAMLGILSGLGMVNILSSLMLTLLCLVTNIPSMLCGLFMKRSDVLHDKSKAKNDNKRSSKNS